VYKHDILSIINQLFKVYSDITGSAKLLDHIFAKYVGLLNKAVNEDFTLVDLHTEEFFNTVYAKDDFIKAMIIEVKQREIDSFIQVREGIDTIENEINSAKKVMKKLKEFTERNTKIFMEEVSELSGDIKYDVRMLNDFLIQTAKYIKILTIEKQTIIHKIVQIFTVLAVNFEKI
jgi:hypothetical protein